MLLAKLRFFQGYQVLIIRIVIWLLSEVILNYVGIDDLADYSEFLSERPVTVIVRNYTVG